MPTSAWHPSAWTPRPLGDRSRQEHHRDERRSASACAGRPAAMRRARKALEVLEGLKQ